VNAELKIKEHYVDLASVIAGIKPASVDEQEKAISEVFKMLMMFRSGNRIEGKILSNDLEKRIAELEKTVANQSKLVDQITGFLFKPKPSTKKAQAS
jgi:regulatory protein YycH of two-component signal transduction system YycFG